ncbi:MAG TPA: metalloregulator ArsR/SmtB family transcription factor [Thermoanaerobaculia bacterium]|jgi:DNA-binding transcriptional ArsR family regulator
MTPETCRHAGRFAALGHEVRLEIVRRLLAAHPRGMVAGEIQQELNIPASTLSHHLDALHQEKLVEQRREGRFLRYLADTEGLRELLDFLYAECCTRNEVVRSPAVGGPVLDRPHPRPLS